MREVHAKDHSDVSAADTRESTQANASMLAW